jgi:ABC-type sugar transport system permease subunit
MTGGISPQLRKRRFRDNFIVGVCLSPSVAIILVFTYFAFLFCVYLSLHNWNMLSPMRFIGLENYRTAFISEDSGEFWNALRNTFVYVAFAVPACVILGLLTGLLLDWIVFARGFFRLMLFLPVIVSMVVAATVWKLLFDPETGEINRILFSLGVKASHWTKWTKDPAGGAMAAVLIVGIWKRIGYNGVLFLAGLKNISGTFYEAATIDGASPVQKFFKITLPLVSPTTFIVTMLQFFSAFKVVESILVMTNGGPAKNTDVLVLYIYNNAFSYLKMGYASAISVILFVIILFFTIIQLVLEKRMVHYQ